TAQDEIERRIVERQRRALVARPHDLDAEATKALAGHGRVDLPLLGRHEPRGQRRAHLRQPLAAARTEVERRGRADGVLRDDRGVVPRPRLAELARAQQREVPAREPAGALHPRPEPLEGLLAGPGRTAQDAGPKEAPLTMRAVAVAVASSSPVSVRNSPER